MSDVYEPWERLVRIVVLGKALDVPEKNLLLRQLQYVSEDVGMGRYCWNAECRYCEVSYQRPGDETEHTGLACRLRGWSPHYSPREQGTAGALDDELPPSALLITSPRRMSKHGTVARKARPGRGTTGPFYPRRVRTMNRISLWQSCAPMRPQQMAQSSKSFMRTRAAHEILPHQHLMDTGYGDAEVLAEKPTALSR